MKSELLPESKMEKQQFDSVVYYFLKNSLSSLGTKVFEIQTEHSEEF